MWPLDTNRMQQDGWVARPLVRPRLFPVIGALLLDGLAVLVQFLFLQALRSPATVRCWRSGAEARARSRLLNRRIQKGRKAAVLAAAALVRDQERRIKEGSQITTTTRRLYSSRRHL
jgi:hypothetical protein